jgi:4-amino-4-deoxy-L-arabinose transferase-like glycosyltransferase
MNALLARLQQRTTVVAVVVGVLVFALHALCLPQQALTDDDDFYAPAGIRYADWLVELFTSPSTALSTVGIDAGFGLNHEHPPFAKYVFGLAHHVGVHLGFGSLDAARLGTAAFVGVLAATLLWWLARSLGVVTALLSVLALLTMPRFFLHSEVPTLDVPVAVMIVVVTACFDRARDRVFAGVLVGVVFGLATATKLNAPFAVVPLVLITLVRRRRQWKLVDLDGAAALPAVQLPRVPPSLWAMAVVGPLVFFASWPWLWPNVVERVGAYVAFHLQHYPIFLFYDGEIWSRPFAPGTASLVQAVGSLPAPIVVAAAIGAAGALQASWRYLRGTDIPPDSPTPTDDSGDVGERDRVLTLVLLQAVVSLGLVALSDVPRYGGEKLFMPLFPFVAVLAAVGAATVVNAAAALLPRAPRSILAGVVGVGLLAPGVAGIARTWGGYGLSYYGEFLGGLRGAVARGHERTYYDLADKALARRLDDVAHGQRVHVEPNHKEYVRTWQWLRKDGVMARYGFVIESSFERADIVVLTHERRWSTYPALRERLRHWRVVDEKRIDGVPLWTIYARP